MTELLLVQCMERPAQVMFTKLRSVINLTDDDEEEVVFLNNDHSADGIALTNDIVPEMARVEDLEVAEAESKAFTDVLAPDLSDVKVINHRQDSHVVVTTLT